MLNKESYMPYYLQIYEELTSKINSGLYKPGDVLPSENELSEEYSVTRATVRAAVNKLKEKGLIHTKKGKGSFVNHPRVIQELNKIYTFREQFETSGYEAEVKIVESYVEKCSSLIMKALKLTENDTVRVIKMLRKLDGIPSVFQTIYLPTKIFPSMDSFDGNNKSIYEFIEDKYGVLIMKAKEFIDPVIADENEAGILQVKANTPLFLTERITYAKGDIPIEYRKCLIRNDKVRFAVELY